MLLSFLSIASINLNKIVRFHYNTGHVQAEREPPLLQQALASLAEYFMTASNKHIKHTSSSRRDIPALNQGSGGQMW